VANLYIGPFDNPPPLSLVDPDAPDLAKYPRYAEAFASARVAYLDPGDAIFIPKHWWHNVVSLGAYNAMVNYWWGDTPAGIGNPSDAFLTALLALKDLPPGERNYWHAMFEAYVFGDEAAAHLPAPLQGALGRLSPQQRAMLRQQLKAAILKSPEPPPRKIIDVAPNPCLARRPECARRGAGEPRECAQSPGKVIELCVEVRDGKALYEVSRKRRAGARPGRWA
jgi:hypothetical protein